MKKYNLEVEFDETFEASFRVGLVVEELVQNGFENTIIDNLFQKFLREKSVIKPNQDYILSSDLLIPKVISFLLNNFNELSINRLYGQALP